MNYVMYSLLLVLLITFPEKVRPQNAGGGYDQVYGLDQVLCNGKKYNFIAPAGTRGDQYLISPIFLSGHLNLNGKLYENVILNYDIFNQQLLLQYSDIQGVLHIIVVSTAWLKGFTLGNRVFEQLSPDNVPAYYQVLGDGEPRIVYAWHKSLNLNEAIGASNLQFTKALKDSYVLIDGKLKFFNTRRSFIAIFNPALKLEIRSYLRKHKIRMKSASDGAMRELINYIGKIR